MILFLQVEESFELKESSVFGINLSLDYLEFLTSGNLKSFCPHLA